MAEAIAGELLLLRPSVTKVENPDSVGDREA